MTAQLRDKIALALCILAMLVIFYGHREAAPAPKPPDPHEVSLLGKFVGPTASDDAATVAALCDELARIIEADGKREVPKIKTGAQIDELRITAREGRTRGVSIGERQPLVRDEIRRFLDETVGVSSGPFTADQRKKWIDAFFEISRASSRASGK